MNRHGTTALITGASSGIGAEFARRLAADGCDLVLVARRREALATLAAELHGAHGIDAEVLPCDLTSAAELAELLERVRARRIDVVVNAAGFGTHGAFEQQDEARMMREISLDVTALVAITRALLPAMLQRGSGAVVNVASTGAFQPLSYMAVYGACKAFVLSFTEALWGEAEGTGVRVLTLAPGPTETEFFHIAGEAASVSRRMTVESVVADALAALEHAGPPTIIPGGRNRATALGARFLPRLRVIRAGRRMMNPTRARTAPA